MLRDKNIYAFSFLPKYLWVQVLFIPTCRFKFLSDTISLQTKSFPHRIGLLVINSYHFSFIWKGLYIVLIFEVFWLESEIWIDFFFLLFKALKHDSLKKKKNMIPLTPGFHYFWWETSCYCECSCLCQPLINNPNKTRIQIK